MPVETKEESGPFRALYDANYRRIHRLLGRIAGTQEAEDLTQMVFAKAAKALPQFRGDAHASTWLHRIAVSVASDWFRSRMMREAKLTVSLPEIPDGDLSPEHSAAIPPGVQLSPEQALARKDMRDCIRAEIGRLPENSQTVLILGELGGLTDEEVAQTLGISRANAKVRLHRARAQLRKIIEARCDFYRNELSCAPSSPDCCASSTRANGAASGR